MGQKPLLGEDRHTEHIPPCCLEKSPKPVAHESSSHMADCEGHELTTVPRGPGRAEFRTSI